MANAPTLCERLFAAAERSGVTLLTEHRQQILGLAEQTADPWLDDVVTAIAQNLPAGGLKNVEWGPIKGALLASRQQIDAATNARIADLFDRFVAVLNSAVHTQTN